MPLYVGRKFHHNFKTPDLRKVQWHSKTLSIWKFQPYVLSMKEKTELLVFENNGLITVKSKGF